MAQFLDYTGLGHFKDKNDALYAKQDGYYELLTSGNAEQLVSTVGVSDNAPYVFRTTGGSADVGDRMNLKAVVGGTVAWNQLIPTVIKSASLSFSEQSNYNQAAYSDLAIPIVAGHKMFMSAKLTRTISENNFIRLTAWQKSPQINIGSITLNNGDSNGYVSNVISVPNNAVTLDQISFNNYSGKRCYEAGDSVAYDDYIVIDLTAMFGSAIADYVYTLESNTAGAGVAWLKSYGFFTKPYYPYAAENLQSVKTSAHKTYGFNAYDNTTGKAKVVGGMVYQITGAYTALSLDGTSITPDASGYFTPSANGELTVTGGNGTTTCIHLKWDGERDGEYEPYEQHTYALDDVELRGIPKLDASNNLYYDGDEYTPDGTVTRKYGIVDLGTLSWTYDSSNGFFYSNGINSTVQKPYPLSTTDHGFVCAKYSVFSGAVNASDSNFSTNAPDKTIAKHYTGSVAYIYIKDSAYTDKNTFTTAMNGVYLVYELATPTTESADAYTELQICNDFGTEEFVDAATRDFDMPVCASAIYRPNLRAKLEMAPNSPSNGNGDYIVRQTDGVNEYVLFSEVKELPDLPTTDGTYTLKCTVTDGEATLSWVSE